jgi:hypothetical protein
MPLGMTFIPHPRRTAIAIVGNSISTAHAAIALLNALAFITDLSPVEVAETFARLLDSRLKASSLTIHEVEGGIVLSKSDIAPTLPMHACELLVLKSPTDETRSHVQVGLNIRDVLKTLLGASIPTDLFLVPAEILDHKSATSCQHVDATGEDHTFCIGPSLLAHAHHDVWPSWK